MIRIRLPKTIRDAIARRNKRKPRCTADNLRAAGLSDAAIVPDWDKCWPDCGCPPGTVHPDCPAMERNRPESQRQTWINDNLPDIARNGEGQ